MEETECIYHKNGKKKRCVIYYQSPVNHWEEIKYYDEKGRLIKEADGSGYLDENVLEHYDTTLKQSYFYNDADLLMRHINNHGNDSFETKYFYTSAKKEYKRITFKNGERIYVIYSMYDLESNLRAIVSDYCLKGRKSVEYINRKHQLDSVINYENDKIKDKTIYVYKGNKTTQITRNNKNEIIVWSETEILKDANIQISTNATGWILSKIITYKNNIEITYGYNYDVNGKLLGWREIKVFCHGLNKIYDVEKNAKGEITRENY